MQSFKCFHQVTPLLGEYQTMNLSLSQRISGLVNTGPRHLQVNNWTALKSLWNQNWPFWNISVYYKWFICAHHHSKRANYIFWFYNS